jgi:hypothetical protein
METNFIKNNSGLFLTGTIIIWYFIATGIDLIWLKNTNFSNLFILKEAYLGMKPVGIPLPESGILLFLFGTFPIVATYLLIIKEIPKEQTFKHILGILGFSFLIFILLVPILVAGEIAYLILIKKLCKSVSWLEWITDILDLFSFKAMIQASFIKNPMTLDMSLGGFLALYIGIPIIRRKMKI